MHDVILVSCQICIFGCYFFHEKIVVQQVTCPRYDSYYVSEQDHSPVYMLKCFYHYAIREPLAFYGTAALFYDGETTCHLNV